MFGLEIRLMRGQPAPPGSGADWVRQNGELVIGGEWLSESGITDVEQLDVTAAPGVIRLRRWEV